MTIKGLSEKRRMPRAGKIKLGIQVTNAQGKTYPKATDYFVCPAEVQAKYGERPTELPIMFPMDDPELAFPQDYKMYKQSGLFCRGNGETAHRWNEAGSLQEMTCPCPFLESGDCGPQATLNFFLPDVPGFGVWQITTGSQRSIVSLNSSLENFAKVFGGLSGIRLILRLEPEQIQRHDAAKGGMVKQTLHVMRLDCKETIAELIELRSASLSTGPRALPPAAEVDALPPVDAAPAVEEPAEPDAQAETLWTMLLDVTGQDPKKALLFGRVLAKKHLRREIEGLADLSPDELVTMIRALATP